MHPVAEHFVWLSKGEHLFNKHSFCSVPAHSGQKSQQNGRIAEILFADALAKGKYVCAFEVSAS